MLLNDVVKLNIKYQLKEFRLIFIDYLVALN